MYWEKEIETIDRGRLEQMQLARLKETLERTKKSVYYRKRFAELGVNADRIDALAEVQRLPLTTKEDLREQWPYGFLAVSRDESSGCTPPPGRPAGPR